MRQMGHLQLWAVAANVQILLLMSSGDPRWLRIPPELMKVATEAGDSHMLGWATLNMGLARNFEGDPKGAAEQFGRSRQLLEAVPDHAVLSLALSQLASAFVQLGRPQEAFPLLARSRELRRQHRVRAQLASPSILSSAECYLIALENKSLDPRERAGLLNHARKACDEATRHGRRVHDHSGPDAMRLRGMLEWQRGKVRAARQAWARACDLAERAGARYVLAQTRYEIGRRFKSRDDLESAERLYMAAGALAGLAKTRRALAELGQTGQAG
jgi:tetratricopeptide (TPR) repeat protein